MNAETNENAGETKGIRIEPTPALYSFLKAVQKETRPFTGRKIPLADILTSLAMMNIAGIADLSEEELELSSSMQIVQEQLHNDFEQNAECLSIEQPEEQEQVNISSVCAYDHESYAREYLDNYNYCLQSIIPQADDHEHPEGDAKDQLQEQISPKADTETIEADSDSYEAEDHIQDEELEMLKWHLVPKGYTFEPRNLSMEEERLPYFFPHLYEDIGENEEQGEQEKAGEPEQLPLKIVHSSLHEAKANISGPVQDQEQAKVTQMQNVQKDEGFSFRKAHDEYKERIAQQANSTNIPVSNGKVLLKDNPFFKSLHDTKSQKAVTPPTPQEPSAEAKQIEHFYQEYTKNAFHRICYILWKEGREKFLQRLGLSEQQFQKEITEKLSILFMARICVEFHKDYGSNWIEKGIHEAAGPKVKREEFVQMHNELLQRRANSQVIN